MADRYCTNCGHGLNADSRFCPNCGRPVHEVAEVPTPEADVDVPPPPSSPSGAWQSVGPLPGPSEPGWGRRHPILTGCLGIIGLFVLLGIIGAALGGGDETAGGAGGGGQQAQDAGREQQAQLQADEEQQVQEQADGGQQDQEQEAQAERKPPPEPEYTVGQTATVGNVEWTVSDAYRTNLLRSNFGTRKQGNFVVVDFTFTNNRSEEVTIDPELHMILRDSEGREFGTDPDAWEFVPPRLDIFLQPVNPGISQDGRVIYQVPPDAEGFVLIVDDVELMEDKTARYDLGTLPTRAPG
jgi:predicted  nucleic acid-binding Zn-ribbon protein